MIDAILRALLAAMFVMLVAGAVLAQDNESDPFGALTKIFDEPVQVLPDGADPELIFPDLPLGFEPSDATLAAIDVAVHDYYAYRTEQYAHRQAVFAWQHSSSRLLFFVVIGVVLVGLYFSWLQFHAARTGRDLTPTTLEASKTGLKVSSPVLGVIILLLSLAFFYLYLVHVYPISEVF
ncbi:hypothetical protein [uncultured Jannaschia sp.]|uniref:hypothetical protein n=1 Tax=uncultured Jannaschia sp. TaxID=293347 RepID=UPI0026249380|nr:hypothetical protein [uncultured Jannaschia sp.]